MTAEQHARQAVQVLDEHDGRLPALRGDEIDHHAACVLAAAGHLDDAAALDDRAQQECERRLELIHPAHQSGFRALKTNRMILEGGPERDEAVPGSSSTGIGPTA